MSIDQTEYVVMISKESCTIIFKFNDTQGRGICARAWCHLSFKENKLIHPYDNVEQGRAYQNSKCLHLRGNGFGYRAWQY